MFVSKLSPGFVLRAGGSTHRKPEPEFAKSIGDANVFGEARSAGVQFCLRALQYAQADSAICALEQT